MSDKPTPRTPTKQGKMRDDRLKAALKANLGRRKAQSRARDAGPVQETAGRNAGSDHTGSDHTGSGHTGTETTDTGDIPEQTKDS